MLRQISLDNIAIIDRLTVAVEPGLTIITGETGSGKSLLLDAVALGFGAKTSAKDILKSGAQRGRIELSFDAPALQNPLRPMLETMDLWGSVEEAGELLVSREFFGSGSRFRLNGTPVTREQLLTLRPYLVDLHGQHELSNLFQKNYQRQCVDQTGGEALASLKNTVREAYKHWSILQDRIDRLQRDQMDRERRLDFLRFQAQELEQAELTDPEEDTRLKVEIERLSHGEKLRKAAESSVARLTEGLGDQLSIQEQLRQCERLLREPSNWDSTLAPLFERLSGMLEESRDLAFALSRYAETVESSPETIDSLVERVDRLEKLKRKYGPTLADVLATWNKVSQELLETESVEETLALLQAECAEARQTFTAEAQNLTQARRRLADPFQQAVAEQLKLLALPAVRFAIDFTVLSNPTADGMEEVQFMFSANPGEPLRSLAAVASGGELSRVLLAIKLLALPVPVPSGGDLSPSAFLERETITMIFDEIDTGISGKAAQSVAECLVRLSRQCGQALVITHQPIVAAVGDQHLHVEKRFDYASEGQGVATGVTVSAEYLHLKKEKRLSQLSRLASGIDTDDEAVEQFIGRLLHKADALKN